MSDQLEIDGQRTEQLILARRKLKQQNQELFNLQALHQCKKGLFCLVKQAELCYDVTQQGHELSYTLNKQRQSFMTMVGVKPIKVTQQSGPVEGSILCQCTNSECMYTMVKTLCGLKELLTFN